MNLVGLIINLSFSHNFELCLKKLKLEASMYQRNGMIGISNQRERHPYFYFIVTFSSYYQLIPLSIILCFLEKSRVEPKLLQHQG